MNVVMFSGGVASWAASRRLAERGTDDLCLLFADTLMEDEDLYRFLVEAAADIGAPLIRIAEGRTPWDVFFDEKMMGNTRADPCSRILKRETLDRWIIENCDPATTTVHMGYTFDEFHRWERLRDRWSKPWSVNAPLCEKPWLTRIEIHEALRQAGIKPPRLYAMGFPHNNCGGFCVKAGQGGFATLLANFPERYAYHEAQERRFRQETGKDVSILRDRASGATTPLTLTAFRERREVGERFPEWDFGGCGCMEEP